MHLTTIGTLNNADNDIIHRMDNNERSALQDNNIVNNLRYETSYEVMLSIQELIHIKGKSTQMFNLGHFVNWLSR